MEGCEAGVEGLEGVIVREELEELLAMVAAEQSDGGAIQPLIVLVFLLELLVLAEWRALVPGTDRRH